MIEKINSNIQQYHYNTISKVQNSAGNNNAQTNIQPAFTSNSADTQAQINKVQIRTTLNSKEEKEKYTAILTSLSKNDRRTAEILLKSGILLNNESDDNSTVLDNLYKMITEERAAGLDGTTMLRDTITTLAYPYVITQQFGDIPASYQERAIQANTKDEPNLIKKQQNAQDINVEHSGTCVAASTEFKLAKQMPAEFTRFAQELSSPKLSVDKTIGLKNLADNTLNGIWLLNAFEIPYEMDNFDNAKLKFAPDEKAIIRAQIQTTDRDPFERSPLDVLMQSTFMQVGSQQSYNSLTDKREGKFNQSDKGLIEFEKTFTESVVFNKNILSVTYQTVDENARLIGYETDLGTMKGHLIQALDEGENVIIGYTQTDANNIIMNGHEITIVDYKKDQNGRVTFICNDTDDNISRPVEYPEEYLLPKIHHAALPQHIVEEDLNFVPNWVEGIEAYKQMKSAI